MSTGGTELKYHASDALERLLSFAMSQDF